MSGQKLVTRSNPRRTYVCNQEVVLFDSVLQNPKGSGERLQGHHGPLVSFSCNVFKRLICRVFSSQDCVVKVSIVANERGVCFQNTSKSHSHHLRIWHLL